MAKKRKLAEVYASADSATQRALPKSLEPRLDPVSGQRCAIPGLDESDGDIFDDASRDALAYLRSVRSEAASIPALLRTAYAHEGPLDVSVTNNLQRGYYVDGAYIAVPASNASSAPDAELNGDINEIQSDGGKPAMIEAQHAYHTALLSRFVKHRTSFHSRAPRTSQATPTLDVTTHPTAIDSSIGRVHEAAKWNRIVQTTPPCTAQMVAMSQDDVLWLLEHIPTMIKHKKMVADGGNGGRVLGAWLWALLGQLGDLGTLSSEEVSIVRELGKRAGSIIVGMELARDTLLVEPSDYTAAEGPTLEDAVGSAMAGTDEVEDDANALGDKGLKQPSTIGGHDGQVESDTQRDIDAAKTRLLSAYVSSPTSDIGHTLSTVDVDSRAAAETPGRAEEEMLTATLDMILTVVGEFYGQRDLLVTRDRLWERSVRSTI